MEGVFPANFSATYLMLAGQSLNPDDDLALFIRDALRFTSAFIVPISQSAPHVYLSALPFAPEESHVAGKFCSRFPNTFAVIQGKSSKWPMAVFTAEHQKDRVWDMAFSPDESTFLYRSVAPLSRSECATSYICDSETGRCILGPFHHTRDACFSPAGKHILLQYSSYAEIWDIETGEEQFRIEGSGFAFVHHGGRIASMKKDGNLDDFGARIRAQSWATGATRILVQFWDAGNGELISSRLLEVNDVLDAQFSPDGYFLALLKRSENVIELWNLEDSKNLKRFRYPRGDSPFLHCSPTSDTLMVISGGGHTYQICLSRLDAQEMAPFTFDYSHFLSKPHVIHSPPTSYLFIVRDYRAEIWDVSATGSKTIRKPAFTSSITSICPSRNGNRVLVGYWDGSVSMWNLDLENLAIIQADTTDTRDVRQVISISPSEKMKVRSSQQSHSVEFLDTSTSKVVAHTDIEYEGNTKIAFSPNEEQVAFLSKSLITICDIMHPEKRISFDPWLRRDVWNWEVAFQTCNDLVICGAISHGGSLLQVWHRQGPAGFKCTYSWDIKSGRNPYLAPDGLTVVVMDLSSSTTCYSWNHETTQFDPVHSDDPVHFDIRERGCCHPPPAYSLDGKLLAYWSSKDPYVRVWDTRTCQLVSKFPMSEVHGIALSPALIDHSLGERLIALSPISEKVIRLFDAYTGHLHAQILGQTPATMAFIQNGTALANYDYGFGVRVWRIADLTAEHWHSTDGYELMLQGMRDGWMMGQNDEMLFWVPVENRLGLYVPPPRVLTKGSQITTILDHSKSRLGRKWTECIDKEWLRELRQKEKEVGKLLE